MLKTIRTLSIATILISMLLLIHTNSLADGGANAVTVDFSLENHTKGISGAEFGIIKVLDLKDGYYKVTEPLSGMSVTVDDVLKKTETTAKTLSAKLTDIQAKKTTDAQGRITFDSLTDGVWMIVQTGRSGDSASYNLSAPSMVTVPYEQGGKVSTSVTVYPKTTILETAGTEGPAAGTPETEPKEDTKDNAKEKAKANAKANAKGSSSIGTNGSSTGSIRTGDDTAVTLWTALLATSCLMLLSVIMYKRRRVDEG